MTVTPIVQGALYARLVVTHLPIQQIKWLYRCGGCMEEFIYHPFEARLEPKQEWDEMRSCTKPS